jgi:hypothetical protein
MLLVSVAVVEPPLEVLDIPPEELLPPLEVLDIPPEELLPPELVEVPELLEEVELPELVDPVEPLLDVPVFKPGPELPLLGEDPVPPSLVDVSLLLPKLLPERGTTELSTLEPVPPAAQPGPHPTAPTSKANMQPDSVRSNRFTGDSLRRERWRIRRTSRDSFLS